MTTKEEIAGSLAKLPETADGIAAHLQQLGIKGHRGDACECPIANYLLREVDEEVFVCDDGTSVFDNDGDEERFYVEHSAGVAEFIRRFDRNSYEELVS